MPPKRRQELVDRVFALALDPKTKLRGATAALKALGAISRVNLGSIETSMRAEERDAILARIAALEENVADGSSDQAC